LIDEPELSLHVTWQKAFLTELMAIIRSVNFDVLIATHSPFIVGDRFDLMVPLALDSGDLDGLPIPVGAQSTQRA
jgi:predicted ATP-binding protein involved in virulence